MTLNWIPCSARKPNAGAGTAVSPVSQLLPENRGINLPKARRSVSGSGNLISIRMNQHWSVQGRPQELMVSGLCGNRRGRIGEKAEKLKS